MTTVHRDRIILGIPWEDFPAAVLGSKHISTKMAENASIFLSPNPGLTIYAQQCADFEKSHVDVVTTKAKGATLIRLAKRDIVRASSECQRAYVQSLCDSSPQNAGTYAALAGMRIWTPPTQNRDVLRASLVAGTQGEVALKAAASLLVAPGAGKARQRTYLWRHTLDGGKTFVNDDPTPVAHTRITGLPLNTVVGFQVAVKDAVGVSDYCQAVTVYVH